MSYKSNQAKLLYSAEFLKEIPAKYLELWQWSSEKIKQFERVSNGWKFVGTPEKRKNGSVFSFDQMAILIDNAFKKHDYNDVIFYDEYHGELNENQFRGRKTAPKHKNCLCQLENSVRKMW